jgi:hypothetical protein
MARYWISAGIGKSQGEVGPNDLGVTSKYPLLTIAGPSGQFAQVLPPSGGGLGKVPQNNTVLHQSELTGSHVALSWFRNEAILSLRQSYETASDDTYFAWQPYGQPDGQGQVINPSPFGTSQQGVNNRVMFDGYQWKQIGFAIPDDTNRYYYTPFRIGDGAFWITPLANTDQSWKTGVYKGGDPYLFVDGIGASGHLPAPGDYGANEIDPNYQIGADGVGYEFGGNAYSSATIDSTDAYCIMDMVEFKGTIYAVGQWYMIAYNPAGARGSIVFWDRNPGDRLQNNTETASYTDRTTIPNVGGDVGRSLAVHGDELFMLSNEGEIHNIRPGGVIEKVADLTTLETPWSSGIVGGPYPNATSTYNGSTAAYRCKLLSFNNQLHAFLNFQTDWRVAKANDTDLGSQGKGVFWATSHDGRNWADRSTMLPSSGIHSPSGSEDLSLGNWISFTAPYRFSGFTGGGAARAFVFASGGYPIAYDKNQNGGVGLGGIPTNAINALPAQPSGWTQLGPLPFLTVPSGNLLRDPPNTTRDNLGVPLRFGPTSGHLFPTIIDYPLDFVYVNAINGSGSSSDDPHAVLRPSGQGPTGYDYSNVHNYHIAGAVDDEQNVVRLIFSEDFERGTTQYYEMDSASGWTLRNDVRESNQLNSFIPCMLYDPEIVIASGSLREPNPRIVSESGVAEVKYRIYDWPVFDKVNVQFQYSTDAGLNWKHIGVERQKDTGSLDLDPSGVIGVQHTFLWNYKNVLGGNQFYPDVRIRAKPFVGNL